MEVTVDPLGPEHEVEADSLLAVELGGRLQAQADGLQDVLALPGYGAWRDGRLVGLATFDPATRELAAVAVHHDHRNAGIGGRLVEVVAEELRARGAPAVWLVTTNDNLDALRLYQRHGFRITSVDPGAVDRARQAHKPSIPMIGAHGIPLRDEITLERDLT